MNGEPPDLDPLIRSYYERRPEEDRLTQGASQIEAARTKEVMGRYLPSPPATILDVGGAAGAYAFWLTNRGLTVHLVEPVRRLLDLAMARSAGSSAPLASGQCADARALPVPDGFADVVLLLGPLYHLTRSEDRKRAIAEASRALRPGGILFAACITRWASLFNGLVHQRLGDPAFARIVAEDVASGQHRNPTEEVGYFTTAYFHRPDEFRSELAGAGLHVEGVFGLEGPASLLPDFDERWADPERRAELMRAAALVESEPDLMGLSAHLLGVGRKR